MTETQRVALALGSGGARGYAHIGVLEVLEERGYDVVSVAGTSMGALVGGLYAAGKMPAFADWACGLTQRDLIRLLDLSFSSPGAMRAEKILARVEDLLDGAQIEELPIPYTAVATDLLARREVWFQRGRVATAIRASIALPGIITPVMHNGRLLADGGLMNPVPIAPTASAQADLTIAITLDGERSGSQGQSPVQESAEVRPIEEWRDRVRRGAAQVMERESVRTFMTRLGRDPEAVVAEEVSEFIGTDLADLADPDSDHAVRADGALPADLSLFAVMNLSLDALQSVVSRYRMASYPPEVLITVPKDACKVLEFHRASELIALGRKLAHAALDDYEGRQLD